MTRRCNRESVINRGHLNADGQPKAMVARCFLGRYHDGCHLFVYEHILDKNVAEWKRGAR